MNCFGVPGPTTSRRLKALASALDQMPLCVVCFQEVQAHVYCRLLKYACTHYPSSAFQPFIHAPKGGLLTLSRLHIQKAEFTLYTARGRWYSPAVADWILHKGVLATHLTLAGQSIIVLNTHTNANYRADWQAMNHYTRQEQSQLRQLAAIVRQQPPDAIVIVVGDLNIPRGSWLYDEFLAESGMIDPLAGDARPTFRAPRAFPGRFAVAIDYAFVRTPPLAGLQLHSDLRFTDRVALPGGRSIYLSDHCAVELQVAWNGPAQS